MTNRPEMDVVTSRDPV